MNIPPSALNHTSPALDKVFSFCSFCLLSLYFLLFNLACCFDFPPPWFHTLFLLNYSLYFFVPFVKCLSFLNFISFGFLQIFFLSFIHLSSIYSTLELELISLRTRLVHSSSFFFSTGGGDGGFIGLEFGDEGEKGGWRGCIGGL